MEENRARKRLKTTQDMKELFANMYQCQECGFSMAKDENMLHSNVHNKYTKLREENGSKLLTYRELKKGEQSLKDLLLQGGEVARISGIGWQKSVRVQYILETIYAIHFTRSLKFWDYYRAHPQYEEYIILLWNTPSFLKYVSAYLPEETLQTEKARHASNRGLKASILFRDAFIFVSVVEADVTNKRKYTDLSTLDTLVKCSNTGEPELDILEDELDDWTALGVVLAKVLRKEKE